MIACRAVGVSVLLAVAAAGLTADAAPPALQSVDGVWTLRDDAGHWGGPSMGITHQRGPDYQAKKTLDLSGLPASAWQGVRRARLSAYLCVRDYSHHELKIANGLDEFFELVVNGRVHRMSTAAGLPVLDEGKPADQWLRWHDFEIPLDELVRGPNEIVFRLAAPPGKKPDDYLYLGIDPSVPTRHSAVRFGPSEPWLTRQLNAIEAHGEYMVRLYLLADDRRFESTWRVEGNRLDDAAGVVQFAGADGGRVRIEWDPARLDPLAPVAVAVDTAGPARFAMRWLNELKEPAGATVQSPSPQGEYALRPPFAFPPGGVEFDAAAAVRSVRLRGARHYRAAPRRIDMAPRIQPARCQPVAREPACRIDQQAVRLANDGLRAEFAVVEGRLRLRSLYNELAAAEMVRDPVACRLFVVEVRGRRYAGSRDFAVRSLRPAEGSPAGFTATLFCEPIALAAVLTARIDRQLRLELQLTNRGANPVDFKTAFPHFEGLAISNRIADDYYFFPWGGGVMADAPAVLRRGYGDYEALYQLVDLFSPDRGAGLAVRCDDADGRHKVVALRKFVPSEAETDGDVARTPTADEFKWTNSLDAVGGIGLTFEYLRRTRGPGESFSPKPAALWAHAGDWRVAMRSYAQWCRGAWRYRPYPSRLASIQHMVAPGWGQDALFRDGKYRIDFMQQKPDCVELMSWWDWSPLGPRGIPIEEFAAKLGDGKYNEWKPYFVKDPVTGRMMFSNNPGDYDGYNPRFGGLAALREAIRGYQKSGALVTLYTDPFRVDHNTKCGRQWGRLWGVVEPDGKHREDYDAWRMCHDVAEYRRWVAENMARVLRETGADGIRLDEYGHAGSACFSTLHAHTYAERGVTEWQRGVTEATRLVRLAMDEVNPRAVLTTEHPGYDFLMPWIEGCITYDLSVQATPLRPVECNLQRFFFPECKAYEYSCPDPGYMKRLWNGVALFGGPYPTAMEAVFRENSDALADRDCEALLPTLSRYVYVNRFTAGEKTLYTIHNATGHTFAGPVLRLNLRSDEHVFDLLAGREAETTPEGRDGATAAKIVSARLGNNQTACWLRVPKRLDASPAVDGWSLSIRNAKPGWRIVVTNAAGKPVHEQSVDSADAPITLRGAGPRVVKLVDGPRLVDTAVLSP